METQLLSDLINLSGKTAIVTGGAKGIGESIVRRLHEAGANIVLADMDESAAHTLADVLSQKRPSSVYVVRCDVTSAGDVQSVVDAAVEQFGTIDILLTNAGIFPLAKLSDLTPELLEKIMAVNFTGVHLFVRAALPHLTKQGGKIVSICSIDSLHPSGAGLAGYDASKHALWGYLKNIALELAPHNISVNGIAPGGIATPGVAAMAGGSADDIKAAGSSVPMGRWGEPDDIAKAALFLASDFSSFMTGSMVVVDGGKLLQ